MIEAADVNEDDKELLVRIDERVGTILTRLEEGDQRFAAHSKRIRTLEQWRWFLAGGLVVLAFLLKLVAA